MAGEPAPDLHLPESTLVTKARQPMVDLSRDLMLWDHGKPYAAAHYFHGMRIPRDLNIVSIQYDPLFDQYVFRIKVENGKVTLRASTHNFPQPGFEAQLALLAG